MGIFRSLPQHILLDVECYPAVAQYAKEEVTLLCQQQEEGKEDGVGDQNQDCAHSVLHSEDASITSLILLCCRTSGYEMNQTFERKRLQ